MGGFCDEGVEILFIYFEQYLFRGAQFSEAGLSGALMKRKNNTKNNKRLKNNWNN